MSIQRENKRLRDKVKSLQEIIERKEKKEKYYTDLLRDYLHPVYGWGLKAYLTALERMDDELTRARLLKQEYLQRSEFYYKMFMGFAILSLVECSVVIWFCLNL